jgi:hypothetical protein
MAIVYLLCRPPTCPEFPENPEIFAVSLNFLKNAKNVLKILKFDCSLKSAYKIPH